MRPGCLAAGGVLIAGAILAAAAVILMTRGDGSIDLGLVTDYEPGAIVYRSSDRFFVVRLIDGSVIALSDRDPHNPPGRSSCRVTFRPDLGAGDASGRLFDACSGSLYDISGRGLAGDGLDLSRLTLRERDGRVSAKPAD